MPYQTINKLSFAGRNRREYFFYFLVCLGLFILIVLGPIAVAEKNYILGLLDFTIALVLVGLIFYLKKTGDLDGSINFAVFLIAIFFMYLFCGF